jgi:thiamine pyrophosphokinase
MDIPARNKVKRAIVVAGGDSSPTLIRKWVKRSELVIAADAGILALLAEGVVPHSAVGDFDSAGKNVAEWESRGIKLIKLPVAKDVTDTHAALEEAVKHRPEEVVILGGLGGARFDHALCNIGLLEWLFDRGIRGRIVDETNEVLFASGPAEVEVEKEQYTYLSLIPVSKQVEEIVTRGLLYPLRKETLYRGESRGISNEWLESKGIISWSKGKLLILKSRDA